MVVRIEDGFSYFIIIIIWLYELLMLRDVKSSKFQISTGLEKIPQDHAHVRHTYKNILARSTILSQLRVLEKYDTFIIVK